MLKKKIFYIASWVFTAVALYIVFSDLDWGTLLNHLGDIQIGWALLTFALAISSYLIRAVRWEYLFTEPCLSFWNSYRTVILGFFMNNVLPARAGELVRAHLGAKLSNKSRAYVLATIASERLVDALTISTFFLLAAQGVGDSKLSDNLTLICLGFFAAGVMTFVLLSARGYVQSIADLILKKFPRKELRYLSEKFFYFLNGLSPLVNPSVLPKVIAFSLIIWVVELFTYKTMSLAYGLELNWPSTILFFAVFNFATLIPAAPGGIGVIEALGTLALTSVGVPKEQALTIVISLHLAQYIVIGIPGALFTITWKDKLRQVEMEIEAEDKAEADKAQL
jgi:uncharacterized protein (TIRG00374 family)